MKKFLITLAALTFFGTSSAYAGAIQYIGNGKGEPKVIKVAQIDNSQEANNDYDIIVLRGVHFPSPDAKLDARAKAILEEASEIIKSNKDDKLIITGYSTYDIDKKDNINISARRVDEVYNFLTSLGIDPERIEKIAAGSSHKYDNSTEEGRYMNNRVDLFLRSPAVNEEVINTVSDSRVYFPRNSYKIDPQFDPILQRVSKLLKENPALYIRLEGNTDDSLPQEEALVLGEKRIKEVYSNLLSNGANKEQLEMISYGNSNPAVLGEGEAVRAKNRRVDFRPLIR